MPYLTKNVGAGIVAARAVAMALDETVQQSIAAGDWPGAWATSQRHLPYWSPLRSGADAWARGAYVQAGLHAALLAVDVAGLRYALKNPAGPRVPLVVREGAGGAGKSVYEIAKAGGKHFGMYQRYLNESTKSLQKAIRKYERRILEHQNLIKNPEMYLKKYGKEFKDVPWSELSKELRDDLLKNKWPKDIKRLSEQLDIIKGILKSR